MKLTQTTFLLGCVVGGMGAAVVALLLTTSRADTRLLPFQGRLTDATGAFIPDGAKVVEFKIYDAPTGGTVKWAGEVHKLSVNGGLVNTLLGSKANLGNVDFSTPSYLQITIDANNDSQITAIDPPLLPRQSVLPAVYAVESGNSRQLNKADWSAVMVDNNGIPTADAVAGKLSGAKIKDGTIASTKLSVGSGFTKDFLADNAVEASELADNSVDSAAIIDGAVKTNDLAGTVAGGMETVPGAVTSEKIANQTIRSEDIAAQGIFPDRLRRDIAVFSEVKNTDESGGTNIVGWQPRKLGTAEYPMLGEPGNMTLSSDRLKLKPGIYWVRAMVPTHGAGTSQSVIRDVTGNPAQPMVVLRGTSNWTSLPTQAFSSAASWIEGPITVQATEREFEVWTFTSHAYATYGLGVAVIYGPVPRPDRNVFTRVIIEKLQ